MDNIVKDSSIWKYDKISSTQPYSGEIKIGIVREEVYDDNTDSFFYRVEATAKGKAFLMLCRQMSKFGDIYNYEEWNFRDQVLSTPVTLPTKYTNRVGEVVIVAPIDGNTIDGVILGTLKHPGRKTQIKSKKMAYASEFNGLKTTIDDDGAYKVIFQGKSITNSVLSTLVPGTPIPPAKFDPSISNSFLSMDKTGSLELNDASIALPQSIKVDKPNGKLIITSGKVTITIDKASQKIDTVCIDKSISATKSFTVSTADFSIDAKKSVKIKSPQIAIGFGGTELLDTITKLIDAIGTVVVNSPVGACSPIATAPTWPQVILLKTKLMVIKGSL